MINTAITKAKELSNFEEKNYLKEFLYKIANISQEK